jgi:hypothetical protein
MHDLTPWIREGTFARARRPSSRCGSPCRQPQLVGRATDDARHDRCVLGLALPADLDVPVIDCVAEVAAEAGVSPAQVARLAHAQAGGNGADCRIDEVEQVEDALVAESLSLGDEQSNDSSSCTSRTRSPASRFRPPRRRSAPRRVLAHGRSETARRRHRRVRVEGDVQVGRRDAGLSRRHAVAGEEERVIPAVFRLSGVRPGGRRASGLDFSHCAAVPSSIGGSSTRPPSARRLRAAPSRSGRARRGARAPS